MVRLLRRGSPARRLSILQARGTPHEGQHEVPQVVTLEGDSLQGGSHMQKDEQLVLHMA
jgi:hypothetical protein